MLENEMREPTEHRSGAEQRIAELRAELDATPAVPLLEEASPVEPPPAYDTPADYYYLGDLK